MSEIEDLAQLLHQRNVIDASIGKIIGRPALPGHIGEFIAARILAIDLHTSASTAASDGIFREGPLAGKSVNVKLIGKDKGLLNLPRDGVTAADYILVLAGPLSKPGSSKGTTSPVIITTVYLFRSDDLLTNLGTSGVKIGIATSVKRSLWDAAEIYPKSTGTHLVLDDLQRGLLALFAPGSQLP
jgi:hypothetical protein